jgi:hypothetical protein
LFSFFFCRTNPLECGLNGFGQMLVQSCAACSPLH